jgi:hypothetical protein
MTYYSVKICGRKRKTPFKGGRHTVYKKLHSRGYGYDKKTLCWKLPEQNVLLLISIGDYKHTSFDIIIKRVFSADEFKNLMLRSKEIETAHERIRNETIDMAAAKLRNNGHFGLASMLKHNTDIDYVEGGEYTWTDEKTQDAEFTRFDINGQSRLNDIKSKRIVPQEYDAKKQKKIDD